MKYNVDELLMTAYRPEYFADADKQRIWDKSTGKEGRREKKAFRLLPVLMCAAVAVVVIMAVPPVRAAVWAFFASVGEYMSLPAEERPKIEGVEVQPVEAGAARVTQPPDGQQNDGSAVSAQPQGHWMDKIKVEITEAMYDGEVLYLTYTIDGSEVGMRTMEEIMDENSIPYEEYAKQTGPPSREQREDITDPVYNGSSVHLPDGGTFISYDHSVKTVDGITTVTAEFSDQSRLGEASIKGLSGRQQLVLQPSIAERWNANGDFKYSGEEIRIPFTIDADNGMVVKEAQTYVVNGHDVTLTSVNIKPTEISIDLFIPGSWESPAMEFGFSLNFEVYADGELLLNEWGGTAFIDYMTNAPDGVVGQMRIPFPDPGIKELKLVPYDGGTGEKYEEDAIVIPL